MKLRSLAAVCAAVMTVSAFSAAAPVFAVAPAAASSSSASSSTNEADMKKALALVKSRITIPAKYSEFDYTSNKYRGVNSYNFEWSIPNSYDSYRVTVKGDMITSYSSPNYYSSTPTLAKFTADQYTAKAKAWLEKVVPQTTGLIEPNNQVNISLRNSDVTVSFKRVYENKDVEYNHVSVTLNKNTGEIISMRSSWWDNASFPSSSKALTNAQINKIYAADTELGLEYRLNYDYKTKKYTAIPVYYPKTFITYDAFTGKETTMYKDREKYNNTDLYDDDEYEEAAMSEEADVDAGEGVDGVGANKVEFTEAELAALDEYKGLLSSAQFKQLMIKDPYIKVTDKFLTDSFRVSKTEEAESGFMINCRFYLNTSKKENCSYYITADAKTGKVYSFSRYASNDSGKALNVSKASATADAATKYYCSDILSHYKANENNSSPVVKTKYYTESSRRFSYDRYENNIIVSGEHISIGVNSDGIVTSMGYSHTKNVDFGDGKVLSKEKVFERLFAQQKMNMFYDGFADLKSNYHTYLHYRMDSWYMNAATGQLSTWRGTPYSTAPAAAPSTCPYTDIGSSPYKSEITALYNSGVRVFGGKTFQPKAILTYKEINQLMNMVNSGSYGVMPLYYDDYYEEYYDDEEINYIVEEESNSTGDAKVTRLMLAKQFVEMEHYDDAAELKGIYKTPFKDIKANDPDIGYIAIAYAIGAASADGNGNFVPKGYVTREYAMHCIYNYIKAMN